VARRELVKSSEAGTVSPLAGREGSRERTNTHTHTNIPHRRNEPTQEVRYAGIPSSSSTSTKRNGRLQSKVVSLQFQDEQLSGRSIIAAAPSTKSEPKNEPTIRSLTLDRAVLNDDDDTPVRIIRNHVRTLWSGVCWGFVRRGLAVWNAVFGPRRYDITVSTYSSG